MAVACFPHWAPAEGLLDVDVYEMKTADKTCTLWVENENHTIMCQTPNTVSPFHGSFLEEVLHPMAGSMYRLRFCPRSH